MCHLSYRVVALSLMMGILTSAVLCLACINHIFDALLSVISLKWSRNLKTFAKKKSEYKIFLDYFFLAYSFLTLNSAVGFCAINL